MTHDDSDDHQKNSDIDEHLIAKLPFGVHFDSLEGKWLLLGAFSAFLLVMTGSVELVHALALTALGGRMAKPKRFPRIAALEPQPWYYIGGLSAAIPLWMAVRWQLERMGVDLPNVDWAAVLNGAMQVVEVAG